MNFSKNLIKTGKYFTLISITVFFMHSCNKSKPEPIVQSKNKPVAQPENKPETQSEKPASQPENKPATQPKNEPVQLISTMDELKKLIDTSGNKLLVFDLYADWCMPCRLLSPTLTSIASANTKNARFFRINVDKSRDIAAEFGVNGIPFVVFIKNKEAVYAITGLNPKERYESVIACCGTSQTAASCKAKLQNGHD